MQTGYYCSTIAKQLAFNGTFVLRLAKSYLWVYNRQYGNLVAFKKKVIIMKVKSQFYDDASGSTGLLTWANGNGGLTMKNKPIPKNPKSTRQQAIRQSLALANTTWTSMTKDARDSWENWGKTLVKFDRLGNKLVINGWSAFSGAFVLNALSPISNSKLLLGAPTVGNYSSATVFSIKPNTAENKLVLTNDSNLKLHVMVFQGPKTKSTINVNKWGYEYLETKELNAGAHVELPYAVFKNTNNFVRLVAIDDTGRHSLHNDIKVHIPK